MQIFEVIELNEFPWMGTQEILEAGTVADILKEENENKVFLLVDHDTKQILTYNGRISPFKLQIYGGILAKMLRAQLRLFYRVMQLNLYPKNDKIFSELLKKPINGGKAQPIVNSDFLADQKEEPAERDLSVHIGLKSRHANQYLSELPKLEGYSKKLSIVGNSVYIDEDVVEKFLDEEKISYKAEKMGSLNRGFTFFEEVNYSTRILIKNRIVQGIELYVHKDKEMSVLDVGIPVIYEKKLHESQNFDNIVKAIKIPDKLPEDK